MQAAGTPLVPMSLTLPREVRDMIYRYLLSAKYTKQLMITLTLVGAVVFLQDFKTDSEVEAR